MNSYVGSHLRYLRPVGQPTEKSFNWLAPVRAIFARKLHELYTRTSALIVLVLETRSPVIDSTMRDSRERFAVLDLGTLR